MDIKLTRRNFLRVSGVSATLALAARATAPTAPAASTDAEPMAERVEIEFMNWWGAHREPLMDEVIANFHDMNSSVQVNNSVQPWDGREERAATAVASNNPPALIMTQRVETHQFAHENLILPIDDYVQASGIDPDAIFTPEKSTTSVGRGSCTRSHCQPVGATLANTSTTRPYWPKPALTRKRLSPPGKN